MGLTAHTIQGETKKVTWTIMDRTRPGRAWFRSRRALLRPPIIQIFPPQSPTIASIFPIWLARVQMSTTNASLGAVLVVGGCGFLGSHLVKELAETEGSSANISVLDLVVPKNQHPSATYHAADITKRSEVARVLDIVKPSIIFHTASPHPVFSSRAVLENVNILGTTNLIECAKAIGTVKAFVYTSSSSVVHDQYAPLVKATEDMPVLHYPEQPYYYAHTKGISEKVVLAANNVGGMLTISLRPTTLFGEGDKLMTTTMTEMALKGRANVQLGAGKNLVDTTYIGNCAYAQILAARALLNLDPTTLEAIPEEKRIAGEAFNLSNDDPIPWTDFPRLAAEIIGKPVRDEDVWRIPRWLLMTVAILIETVSWIFTLGKGQPTFTRWLVRTMTMERTVSVEKIKSRLGYKPRVGTKEGWERGVRWCQGQQKEKGNELDKKTA